MPSTKMDFPVKEAASTTLLDSGTRFNTSFEPDTCMAVLPFVETTVPATIAAESFIVKPFLAIASFSCLRVVMFPGFIFTVARPFSRLTSTVSTPGTAFNDTRTACAQTSQSIPKIVMLMLLISATEEAANKKKRNSDAASFLI